METKTLVSGPGRKERYEYRPEDYRGKCPLCDSPVVSNCYYQGSEGGRWAYYLTWECIGTLTEPKTCDYRRLL